MLQNLFAIPLWKTSLNVDEETKQKILNQIKFNYNNHKDYYHPDWNCLVHSTISENNNIDYSSLLPFYKKEYEDFASQYHLGLNQHNYWIAKPWYNYYVKHSSQEIHDHIKVYSEENKFNFFSGVHFLKLNQSHPKIVFYNTNTCSPYQHMDKINSYFNHKNVKHSFLCRSFEIDVKENDIIIFPSFLEHAVFKQKIEEPRITISFNINSELH